MNRIVQFARFAFLLGLATSSQAHIPGGIANVAIIDRDSGAVLTPYFYHGEYWVAGRPGARYSIEIRNRLGERLLAVTSVDGVNVVSGATAGWDQTGYVFSPGERYEITGWRKTDREVADFTFTESPNSYAERTGRPANVGVIGVALFRERQPPTRTYVPPAIGYPLDRAQSAPRAANLGESADAKLASAAPLSAPSAAGVTAPEPKLGTGHGEREYSYVSHTEFSKMQDQPNEIIRIRYDSFDNLVALGVVKRPRPAAPWANPFPESPEQQYVPDPPG
ncbi:MAG: hypothetical protein WA803_12460 [Steroidobacteraceae bacterium]